MAGLLRPLYPAKVSLIFVQDWTAPGRSLLVSQREPTLTSIRSRTCSEPGFRRGLPIAPDDGPAVRGGRQGRRIS
jgi:hypothetical protein